MDVYDVLLAPVPAQLANRLKKGQAFDIADRSANLADSDIKPFCRSQDTTLNLRQ